MLITPIPDVIRKKISAQSQRSHASEHRGIDHLTMLQGVSMVGARRAGQHPLDGVDGDLAGLIAVGVGVDGQPRSVVGFKVGLVLRRRHHPDAIGRAVEMAGPTHAR